MSFNHNTWKNSNHWISLMLNTQPSKCYIQLQSHISCAILNRIEGCLGMLFGAYSLLLIPAHTQNKRNALDSSLSLLYDLLPTSMLDVYPMGRSLTSDIIKSK